MDDRFLTFHVRSKELQRTFKRKIIHNPGRAPIIAANLGTAAGSKNLKLIAAISSENRNLVHQGQGLYYGKIYNFKDGKKLSFLKTFKNFKLYTI